MHDFYAVSLNYAGRGAFDCRSELRDAAPGTCNLLAPGELHTGHATSGEGWIYRNLYIETPLMTTLLRSLDWQGPLDVKFKFPLVRDTSLAARLAHVFASLTESISLLQNESLLLSVVAGLITDHLVRGHALSDTGREHAGFGKIAPTSLSCAICWSPTWLANTCWSRSDCRDANSRGWSVGVRPSRPACFRPCAEKHASQFRECHTWRMHAHAPYGSAKGARKCDPNPDEGYDRGDCRGSWDAFGGTAAWHQRRGGAEEGCPKRYLRNALVRLPLKSTDEGRHDSCYGGANCIRFTMGYANSG
jgi:AraC-like ligand binding domain